MWALLRTYPCFYLFGSLIVLLVLLPLFENSERGKLAFATINLLVLATSVLTLGRSRVSFWVVVLLAGPAFVLLVLAHVTGDAGYLAWSWSFSVGTFLATIVHLVRYVLRKEDARGALIDRLYGGAAAYLLIGLLWAHLFALRERSVPGSFAGLDSSAHLHVADLVFLSFSSLTTAGGSDVRPQSKAAKMLVLLEPVVGILYMGAFVARLVSMYGSPRR